MAKQVFKLHSAAKLSGYMKKFSSIEKSLLFEVSDDRLVAKTHTPDKSVVKIGSILITDIMDIVSNPENVKIGLFAVDNFISSFKHFGDTEVKIEITGEAVGSDNVATELKASSKNLKISYPCASLSLFRYIDSDLANKITDTTSSIFSFRIDKETLSRIIALTALDSESNTISIESNNGEISIKGKGFELSLPGVSADNDSSISFYKSHLGFIDKEDTDVFVAEKKVIFKSVETDTTVVIGRVE